MKHIVKYLKKISPNFQVKKRYPVNEKSIYAITGFTIIDYELRIINPERILFMYSKQYNNYKNLKYKLAFTHLKMHFDFMGAKCNETKHGLEINPKHLNLSENLEFDLWVIRIVEGIEEKLIDFQKGLDSKKTK